MKKKKIEKLEKLDEKRFKELKALTSEDLIKMTHEEISKIFAEAIVFNIKYSIETDKWPDESQAYKRKNKNIKKK